MAKYKEEIKVLKEAQDVNEVIERYMLLLLGVVDRPIPSILHLEKEMFIFSNFNPTVKKFVNFRSHYKGPYSQELQALVESPLYFTSAWEIEDGKIRLTEKGKILFKELVKLFENDEKFNRNMESLRLIREIYDRLSPDELLLLIYITYPEYGEKSKLFDRIQKRKEEIARSLLRKGLITRKRYEEILKK